MPMWFGTKSTTCPMPCAREGGGERVVRLRAADLRVDLVVVATS